jgi:hypothetical protein
MSHATPDPESIITVHTESLPTDSPKVLGR